MKGIQLMELAPGHSERRRNGAAALGTFLASVLEMGY